MKNIFVSLLMLITWSVAQAQDRIYVLHWGTPGGQTERANNAIATRLENTGIQIQHERLNGCKGIEIWLKNNPGKPAIFESTIFFEINRFIDPTGPQACDLGINATSLLAIAMSTNFYFCDRNANIPASTRAETMRQGAPKVAYVTGPGESRMKLSEEIIKSINPQARIIKVRGAADLSQGLLSGDFDIVMTVGAVLDKSGASCFLQTEAGNLQPGAVSLKSIVPNTRWPDAGQLSVIIGHNVDIQKTRAVVLDTINKDSYYQRQFEFGNAKVGMAAGSTEQEQWRIVQRQIERLR